MTDFVSVNPGELPAVLPPVPHASELMVTAGDADQGFLRSLFRGGLPPRVLRRVREYIETNLESPLTLQELATTAGLSASHFARAFKQSEGVTPHMYLMKCRLRQAMRLLAGSDLPLSEIAVVAGFADQSHFSRQFRKHIGVTPRSYRWSTR
jgi:AraC-like DNA-binding protein